MDSPVSAAARNLKANQLKVSALSNYRLAGFSIERLLSYLRALGQDVEIVISTQAEIAKSWPHRSDGSLVLSSDRRSVC
jgi:hypothetical protein